MIILKEVGFDSLMKDTKYVIKRFNIIYYSGRFIGYSFSMGTISNFDYVRDIKNNLYVWKINFYDEKNRSYFMLDSQKEKIQDAMELRAINQDLQKITGDITFNY